MSAPLFWPGHGAIMGAICAELVESDGNPEDEAYNRGISDACDAACRQMNELLAAAPETATPSLPAPPCLTNHAAALIGNTHRVSIYVVRAIEAALGRDLTKATASLPAVLTDAQIEAGRVVLKNYAAGDLMAAEAIRDIIRALATSATPVLP